MVPLKEMKFQIATPVTSYETILELVIIPL